MSRSFDPPALDWSLILLLPETWSVLYLCAGKLTSVVPVLQWHEIGDVVCKLLIASLQSLPLCQGFWCVFIISLNLSLHQGSMGKMAVGDEITTINSIPVSKMMYEEICLLMQCLPTSVTLEIQKAASGEKVVLLLYHLFWIPVNKTSLDQLGLTFCCPSFPHGFREEDRRTLCLHWWAKQSTSSPNQASG